MSNQAIPLDILLGILSWLPVKSLFRFKIVSKEWLFLINDPYFIRLHLNQLVKTRNNVNIIVKRRESGELVSLGFASSVNLDDTREFNNAQVLGSCNGILCLINEIRSTLIVLWNISTGEYNVLPYEPVELRSWPQVYRSTLYGFGYDASNDDYKFVRIVQEETNFLGPWLRTDLKVYSLKTNTWRSCKEIPNYYLSNYWGSACTTFVYGALHWLGSKENMCGSRRNVIAFDVATEKHRLIELLNDMERKASNIALAALRGCLCAMATCFDRKVRVWMMTDYGVKESWAIMCYLQDQSLCDAYLKLLLNDMEGEEFKDADRPQLDNYCYFPPVVFTESLVKLG
ncbi:hypothetical protein PTKIN_Ptkin01aG0026300 [Pterospermum kingtungense]